MIVESLKKDLRKLVTKERGKNNAWFFKTGKGEYGEGDIFLGVTVPNVRKALKEHKNELTTKAAVTLLQSKYHEERLLGVLILVYLYKKSDEKNKKVIFDIYLKNTDRINNWDLVDSSASYIVGEYLLNRDRKIIYRLAKSKSLWERRVTIILTLYFIKNGDYKDTFLICEMLMNDKEDLIHKACGWMLREVGKSCGIETLNIFLEKHANKMPRTMLRYALEKHNEKERNKYLGIKNK